MPTLGTSAVSGIADEGKILVTASNACWTGFAISGTGTLSRLHGDELHGTLDLVLSRQITGLRSPTFPSGGPLSRGARRTSRSRRA